MPSHKVTIIKEDVSTLHVDLASDHGQVKGHGLQKDNPLWDWTKMSMHRFAKKQTKKNIMAGSLFGMWDVNVYVVLSSQIDSLMKKGY